MPYKYKRIRLNKERTRDEHRLMMEAHLGRKLTDSEVIHHINNDPRDNRIENLKVMSRSEHAKLHSKNERFYFGPCVVPPTKHTAEEVRQIYLLHIKGFSQRKISRKTGLDRTFISRVLYGSPERFGEIIFGALKTMRKEVS